MAFTIDGVNVTFDINTFESLAAEQKVTWSRSSLKDLRNALKDNPTKSGPQIVAEIRKINKAKLQKYKKAIRYVVFSWPGVVDPGAIPAVAGGKMPNRLDFQGMFATMDGTTDFVDLMYGIAPSRALQPYKLLAGRVRQADDFNNSSMLGNGLAFQRTWDGQGTLLATANTIRSDFVQGMPVGVDGRVEGILPATRTEYAQSMLKSRYSPTRSLQESLGKLQADKTKSDAAMLAIYRKQKAANLHMEMHARMVKSVRRACKGGIAMVASHPGYTAVQAKVHFVLDGLGDLGKMARKDGISTKDNLGEYLPITSSEICFCHRYWNDPEFPLSNVVKFYVNGDRVYAPWDASYSAMDATGHNVISNPEAWLRYALARELLGDQKAFPRMSGTEEDDA